MYCRNCGEKILENAKFCGNCGQVLEPDHSNVPVHKNEIKTKNGMALASMVLGILSLIAAFVTIFIALFYAVGINYYVAYEFYYETEILFMNVIATIMIVFVPALLAIIGLIMALVSRRKGQNGANLTGLILSIITLLVCVIEILIIFI